MAVSKIANIKTRPTTANVADFIRQIQPEQQRADSLAIIAMMKKVSGEQPVLWGTSIIGFGHKRYKSPKTGREVGWLRMGFAPRKANLSLHPVIDMARHREALEKLGKFKTGVGCLYVTRLADVDLTQLKKIITAAWDKN